MADKYSLQFQLGTTLDPKGLKELKKQLQEIGLEGITINSRLSKLTDKQLKNYTATNRQIQKRNDIENKSLENGDKALRLNKRINKEKNNQTQVELQNLRKINAENRKNQGYTIASLKKETELKLKSKLLDNSQRRINQRTQRINLQYLPEKNQVFLRSQNAKNALLESQARNQNIKNYFTPFNSLADINEKLTKTYLNKYKIEETQARTQKEQIGKKYIERKINDIEDKKIERENDRIKKDIANKKREQQQILRQQEKERFSNFINTKNNLYSKANLVEGIANPLFFGYTIPSSYYFTKSVTTSAVNAIERQNQMEMLFGNQTPEMMRFAKQYAKETPIGLQESVDLITRIKGAQPSMGISDQEVKTVAKNIGDFSLVYGRGAQGRNDLIYQLTQIIDKGVADYAQDIKPIYNAGGGVYLDRAIRKRYGKSLLEAQESKELDRNMILRAIFDIISTEEFKKRTEERKNQLPGQIDELTTSLGLLQESIGKAIDKMFGIGDKASKFSKKIDDFSDSIEKGKSGSGLISALLGLAGGGIGLYGYSKLARMRANYFASRGFNSKGVDSLGNTKSMIGSALLSTSGKILGGAMTSAMIYGSWDSIKSSGAKAIEGFNEYSKDNPLFAIFNGIKTFIKEFGAVDTVLLFAGLSQGVGIIFSTLQHLKKVPIVFDSITVALSGLFAFIKTQTLLSGLALGGKFGVAGALGYGAYKLGSYAFDKINEGEYNEEAKKTRQAEQMWQNLKGKTNEEKYNYIQNLDTSKLDAGSAEVIKSLRQAQDYKSKQMPIENLKPVERNGKHNSQKNAYQSKLRVVNPIFQTIE